MPGMNRRSFEGGVRGEKQRSRTYVDAIQVLDKDRQVC